MAERPRVEYLADYRRLLQDARVTATLARDRKPLPMDASAVPMAAPMQSVNMRRAGYLVLYSRVIYP